MKHYLFAVFVLLLSSHNATAQDITPEYVIGKWIFTDSASGFLMSHHFIDRENVTMILQMKKENSTGAFQNEPQNFRYRLNKQDSITVMTYINSNDTFKFVIVSKGVNAFLFYSPEDYERIQAAKKALPGTIAWGWSKPIELEFKRQVEK